MPRDGGVQLGKVLPSARLSSVGVPPLGPTSAGIQQEMQEVHV